MDKTQWTWRSNGDVFFVYFIPVWFYMIVYPRIWTDSTSFLSLFSAKIFANGRLEIQIMRRPLFWIWYCLHLISESEILTACSYKTNPESIFWLMREQRRMKTVVPIIFIKMHFGFIFFSGLELQKSSYKSTRNSKLLFPSTINIIYYESECEGFK